MRTHLAAGIALGAAVFFMDGAYGANDGVIPTSDFFRHYEYYHIEISPSGDLIAVDMVEDGKNILRLINLDELKGTEIFAGDLEEYGYIRDFYWIDNDSIIFQVGSVSKPRTFVAHWGGIENGRAVTSGRELDITGFVVDPLDTVENQLLFSMLSPNESRTTFVYRIDVSSDERPQDKRNIVARGLDRAAYWLTDEHGFVRIAMSFGEEDGRRKYWYRESVTRPWRLFKTVPDDEIFKPIAFTDDPNTVIVLSNANRDTSALMEFDLKSGAFGPVMFELPGIDLVGGVIDWHARRVKGATYYLNGQLERHYFDADTAALHEILGRTFENEAVSIISESHDRKKLILLVHNERNPGKFYQYDVEARRAELLGERAPWLEAGKLAATSAGTAKSKDGFDIQYYLTLPNGKRGKYPLVVMPHGGPYGIRDRIRYDAGVQFLANRGFAVLRMDYRGSAGYGREFLEAGKRQWGKGIEDDIQSVMAEVFQFRAIDSGRVCIVGSSYGGYSALMSLIRAPGRFRCAASFAGVMDIPLMFSSADWAGNDFLVAKAKEVIGDIATEYEDMQVRSPVYRAGDISAPVFIAHGANDTRVDVEHAYRMKIMLDMLGKPYEWRIFQNEGHGLSHFSNQAEYYELLVQFLAKHLNVRVPPPETRETTSESSKRKP